MSRFSSAAVVSAAACALIVSSARAQSVTAEDLGNVPISVVIPASVTVLDVDQKNQLGNKLLDAVTASGMSGAGGPAGFALMPVVTITKESQAGELKKFQIVVMNVGLSIRQESEKLAYASTSVTLTGSGDTREAAITNAINTLQPDDDKLVNLVKTGKERIVGYYKTNCDAIRADAKRRAGTGNVEEAIALLMNVPREANTCRDASAADAVALYKSHRDKECQALVRAARADVANSAFEPATTKLEKVDPGSTCAKDADGLITQIQQKVSKAADRTLELKVNALKVSRETVTKSLSTPEGVVKHDKESTTGVALGFVGKISPRPHILQ